jgi:hypothetical protein
MSYYPDPFLEYTMARWRPTPPSPNESPKEQLVSILKSIITDSIVLPARAAILMLGTDGRMFWLDPRRGSESDPVTQEELLAFATRSWRPTGTLRSLLLDYVTDQFLIRGRDVGLVDVLPSLACFAYTWGGLLIRQLGGARDMPASQTPARMREACSATVDNFRQIRLALEGAVQGIVTSIAPPPGAVAAGAEPAMVRFGLRDDAVTAWWLAPDGAELAREPLAALVQRLRDSSRPDDHLQRLAGLQEKQRECLAAGKELLEEGCPKLANAVKYACSRRRLTCHTMCPHLRVQGLPAQVSLYLDPSRTRFGPTAILVARRAQEEFVLQNPAGVLLYFPPVQLEAQIVFQPANEPWLIPNPRVRMPKGGPVFTHPYAGHLDPDRLASAYTCTRAAPEPMVEMSAAGRGLLPSSAGHYSLPASNDLCLHGQRHTLNRIAEAIRRAEGAGREPDLAATVLSLWSVASLGLTHGHTNSRDHPRINLGNTEPYYPVARPKDLIGTPLAKCISPYDPERPVSL